MEKLIAQLAPCHVSSPVTSYPVAMTAHNFVAFNPTSELWKDYWAKYLWGQIQYQRSISLHCSKNKKSNEPNKHNTTENASKCKSCYRCDKEHPQADDCRYEDAEWKFCRKKGHIETACLLEEGKKK